MPKHTVHPYTAATAIILAGFTWATPALAQPAPRAHVSIAGARVAIERYFGPGTSVGRCKQFAPGLVGCDYETPSVNVGIEADEGVFSGFATVDAHGVHAWRT